jgi:hypothetical protein
VTEPADKRAHPNGVALAALCVPLLGASLLAKFGIPPYAAAGFGIALPVTLLALAVAAVCDQVRIDPRRCGLYCFMIAALTLPQLLRGENFSETSLLMLAAVHVPYILTIRNGHAYIATVLKLFLNIATLLAVLALAQYFLQGYLGVPLLYPLDNFVPSAFIVQGFNAQSTIYYGSHVLRATGMFMLEPSFLTQLLAVAIVAEALTFSRLWRIALYGAGVLAAHAGTGLLILAVCLPLIIVFHRRWDLLLYVALCTAVFVAFSEAFNLERILIRANELSDPHSSGFARFVGGFYLFDQMLWSDLPRALFGYGAGAFMEYTHLFRREVADMPVTKMVFEFGVVGACVYFCFLMSCLFSSPLPWIVSLAIALTFFLNGMYVPFSHGLALSLLVLCSRPARTSHPAFATKPERNSAVAEDTLKLGTA